ncbi:OLC1v1019775C1 [Oldenlandia corymbosa var. corymbosa]|uniref:Delta(3)-Delta(2)-enoyl-CoA isomerase n=1 Tax=Oldenlandia corymbosa var. corymbosa TaxID=529605 RepID=A0AAV1EF87_OLDCO|nr:OLC1v1019775C1 [Oldenlandia corymbosa var. corymbosa]
MIISSRPPVKSSSAGAMCTLEKRGSIFYLTLTGEDEHCLNPLLIGSIRSVLAQVKSQTTRGSVLITSAHGKFFSNGIDLRYAMAAGSYQAAKDRIMYMVDIFKSLVADFISLPMPTIAALTGHAAGCGLLLAMSHDYITMRSEKAVLYMSELDLGSSLPDCYTSLTVMFRSKLGSPSARRALLLRAAKVRGKEALEMGIVDSVHGNEEETMKAAKGLGEELAKKKWEGNVYAEIRKALYPDLCRILGLKNLEVLPSRI